MTTPPLDRAACLAWVKETAACYRRSAASLRDIGDDASSDEAKEAEGYASIEADEADRFDAIAALLEAQGTALARMDELIAGDGFTNDDSAGEAYCPMCGRSRTDGHREACARYALADLRALLAPATSEASR